MSKKSIRNASNESLDIDIIRYFQNNDNEYLIYSLDETVGDGYIKLYASKIIGNTARIIIDDNEWLLVKEIVKDIIKSNHEGIALNVIDLEEEDLENIILQDTRIFKLQGNLVNLLADNKKFIKHVLTSLEEDKIDEVQENITDTSDEIEMDYQELYEQQLEKNKILESKIKEIEGQMKKYKVMVERIKNFIEE